MGSIERNQVDKGDTWDLSPLFSDKSSWDKALDSCSQQFTKLEAYQGKLGSSAQTLASAFDLYLELSMQVEKIYVYAHLRSDEDTTDTQNLGAYQQAAKLYSQFAAACSFINPELLQLDKATLEALLKDPVLDNFKRMIEKIVRYRPHTLSSEQEALLASASEVFSTSSNIFGQLNNADFNFGSLLVDGEEKDLTHATYSSFLKLQNRETRSKAYKQYYSTYDAHKHSLAATLASSVKKDVYLARVKNFNSALEASLFPDKVSPEVYSTLIDTIEAALPSLHQYYELRGKLSGLEKLKLYDTYVPLVDNIDFTHSWEDAVEVICKSLAPLGQDYVDNLLAGLSTNRWVDRFENKGKRSGAYSSGCYSSPPYILMNYKEDDLRDVYTLTHEAGHSMHSLYSNINQSYQDSHYTIFVAEVASTFNEQLLTEQLRKNYSDNPLATAYLINHQLDDIKSTLFRQTMFAEFELFIHQQEEQGSPLTLDTFRECYGDLLQKYFGPAVELDEIDSLECFRIPHFYSAFYVYKYATGLAAAVSLSRQVLSGDPDAKMRYLEFLCSGSKKYPLELLCEAGVDMTKSTPVNDTVELFSTLVSELELALANIKS